MATQQYEIVQELGTDDSVQVFAEYMQRQAERGIALDQLILAADEYLLAHSDVFLPVDGEPDEVYNAILALCTRFFIAGHEIGRRHGTIPFAGVANL